jgi:hypothetical protein
MQVLALLVLSLIGMGVVAALAAAVYASLPRYFLDCAELHGRFSGLPRDEVVANGRPRDRLPEGAALGSAA